MEATKKATIKVAFNLEFLLLSGRILLARDPFFQLRGAIPHYFPELHIRRTDPALTIVFHCSRRDAENPRGFFGAN